jgi:hypothetical protein
MHFNLPLIPSEKLVYKTSKHYVPDTVNNMLCKAIPVVEFLREGYELERFLAKNQL